MDFEHIRDKFVSYVQQVRNGNYFLSGRIAYFFFCLSIGAYVHFLNVFLKDIGLNTSEIGVITGLLYAGMFVFGPVFGYLIDRTGRRRVVYTCFTLYISAGVVAIPFVARATYQQPSHKALTSHTFIAMLVLCVSVKCVATTLPSILDSAVMNIIERKPLCTYGGIRMWGSLGYGVGAIFSGGVTDSLAKHFVRIGLSRYAAAFSLAAILLVVSLPGILVVLGQMSFDVEKQTENEEIADEMENRFSKFARLFDTFKKFENFVFLVMVLIGGVGLMSHFGFFFIFMNQLHASDTLKGAAVQIQSWSTFVIYPFTDMIIKKVGGTTVAIEIGILSFCIRFIADSYIQNPHFFMFTQSLHCLGYGLLHAATIAHTKEIAPKEVYTTTFSLVTGVYFGLSGLIGNMLSGVIYHRFGGEVLYRGMGILSGVCVLLISVYFHGRGWLARIRCSGRKIESVYQEPTRAR